MYRNGNESQRKVRKNKSLKSMRCVGWFESNPFDLEVGVENHLLFYYNIDRKNEGEKSNANQSNYKPNNSGKWKIL